MLMDLAGDPRTRLPASELARRSVERLAPFARELGCADALAEIERTISWGNGATRMMRAFNANKDMTEPCASSRTRRSCARASRSAPEILKPSLLRGS